jgi:hypothetical protein
LLEVISGFGPVRLTTNDTTRSETSQKEKREKHKTEIQREGMREEIILTAKFLQ